MEISDTVYAKIVNDVLKFVLKEKTKDKTLPIVDLITSYCFKKNLEIEMVGDAISQDFYFKQLIDRDLKAQAFQSW